MTEICGQTFEGERALFHSTDIQLTDCIFQNGESPLKECEGIVAANCEFGWKYPVWYCKNVEITNSIWQETARAGVWYAENILVKNAVVHAPKNFRRCRNLQLEAVSLSKAEETLWHCSKVHLRDVSAKGDYFGMDSEDLYIDGLKLDGNYPFDGCRNVEVHNSRLLSKDAFWNCENVVVYDSYISGEYLGWNSKNVKLVRCTIESLQGMCYIENLVLEDCELVNTTLAFEYCTVDAQITGTADSILNPTSGTIRAEHIGKLILEPDRIDPSKTTILCETVDERLGRVVYE